MRVVSRTLERLWVLLLAGAGCAAPAQPQRGPAVFFPPAPELPRVQYLTSFSGTRDIERQSAFDRFVVGELPDLKVDKPYGVALHDGKIYVCDTNGGVAVFDLRARTFRPLAGAVGPGRLRQPTNIAVAADGHKYVSDPVRGQVVVFGPDDRFVRAYGEPGKWRPVDAVPFADRLYVADLANRVVEVLERESGRPVATLGNRGDPGDRFDRPTNLAVDARGHLYVTDFGRFQVLELDPEGRVVATFGSPGDAFGHFARPKGLAVDREGRLLVVDAAFNNVQVFNPEGRLLMAIGQGGPDPGDFLLPAKVAVDYEHVGYFRDYLAPGFEPEYLIVVTNQFSARRVDVLAYGREAGRSYPTDAALLRQIEEKKKSESASTP